MRKVLKAVLILLLTYPLLLAGFYIVMCQRPGFFAQVMAKTPDAVFIVFPFKPMWLSARKGHLKVGNEAPDFTLETFDQKSTVQLSAFRDKKPVVLVFGSYT
jgi:hypothetical protein